MMVPWNAFSATVCVFVVAVAVEGIEDVVVEAVVGAGDESGKKEVDSVMPSGGVAVAVFVIIEVIAVDEQAFKSVMEPAAPAARAAFFKNSLREIPSVLRIFSFLSVMQCRLLILQYLLKQFSWSKVQPLERSRVCCKPLDSERSIPCIPRGTGRGCLALGCYACIGYWIDISPNGFACWCNFEEYPKWPMAGQCVAVSQALSA